MKLKFDIKKAQTGKYGIVTRSGVEVHKIVWFKGALGFCLFALVGIVVQQWTLGGHYRYNHNNGKHNLDLFLIKKP